MNKNIVKVLAILVLVCTFGSLMVACKKHEHTFVEGKCECGETDPNYKPEETPALGDYKLGLGTVISLDSSATETAQIDGTIAAVVLDKDGKIVLCRIDAIQNKIKVKDFLDKLGRWLEMQPVTIGTEQHLLEAYPALTDNREIKSISRSTPAYLDTVEESKVENWVISMILRYKNEYQL